MNKASVVGLLSLSLVGCVAERPRCDEAVVHELPAVGLAEPVAVPLQGRTISVQGDAETQPGAPGWRFMTRTAICFHGASCR